MIKKLFFAAFACFVSSWSFAQSESRSLVSQYQDFFDPAKAINNEKRIDLLESRLADAREINDQHTMAQLLKERGMLYLTVSHDYGQAMHHFVECLAIEDSIGKKQDMVFTYLAIGDALALVGDHYSGFDMFEKARALSETNDQELLAFILLKQGTMKRESGDEEDAENRFESALKIVDDLESPTLKAQVNFQMALLKQQQDDFEGSMKFHKDALQIHRANGDKQNEAVSLNAIGELYSHMKNYDKSYANHVVALAIRKELKDELGIAQSYNNIGAYYYQKRDFQKAIANLNLAIQYAGGAQDQIRKSYEYLSYCYKEEKDFAKALEMKERFLAITEMIESERTQSEVIGRQNRYDVSVAEKTIGRLESIRKAREKQLAEEKQFRLLLYVLLGSGVVIAILVTWLYLQKRKSNKILQATNKTIQEQNLQLQELNATKDKFFSIISHDLKGPLNSLTSFSGLLINHTDSLSKDEIRMVATDVDKSLKNLFDLLENLLEWSRSQTGNIDFKSDEFDLHGIIIQNLQLLGQQAKVKNISLDTEGTDSLPVSAHKHSINTVVRNILSNAIKFTPNGGAIKVSASREENFIRVAISDNGVGMSPEVVSKLFRIDSKVTTKGTADEKGTGLGLILCKDFVEKNGGKIWVESKPGNGTTFYFTVPSTQALIHHS